jgi:hypothetical protein
MLEGTPRQAALLVLFGALGNCAQPAQKPAANPTEVKPTKADVDALNKRETTAVGKAPISYGKLSGQLETLGTPKFEDTPSSIKMTVTIGTVGPLNCEFYKSETPASAPITKLLGEAASKVKIKTVRVVDVVAINDYPAVFLESEYVVKTAQGKGLGMLKTIFFDHPTTPMFCVHDENGYAESFRRITKDLAASLKMAGAEPKPAKLTQLYIEKLDGQPVGYTREAVAQGDAGNLLYKSQSALFFSKGKELTTEVLSFAETWGSDGDILDGAYSEKTGADTGMDVSLKKEGAGEYSFKGKSSGKDIAGKFKTSPPCSRPRSRSPRRS